MNLIELVTAQNVTLTNCDREAIHLPGSIQPHGLLFVLTEPHLEIVQLSNNTYNVLGIHPEQLLSKPLSELLNSAQIDAIINCLSEKIENVNPIKLSIPKSQKQVTFNGIVHRSQEHLILELEPVESTENHNFFGFYQMTQGTLKKMQKTSSLQQLCAVIVQEIRKLTGFDRVMVYQFDTDGAGTVIAEDKREDLTSFLGLHFPDSDVPKQAKILYTLNPLRLIPDANYQPVELIPADNPLTHQPLDLSLSVLRSVSPVHIQYLKIMDVVASMSISLIKDQQLWGLIACHHTSPKYVSYEVRTACEFLGRVMALELASKEENENLDYKIKLKSIQSQFIELISSTEDFVEGLVQDQANLLNLVGASGAAVCANGELILIGQTPAETEIQKLITWVEPQISNDIFYTDSLPKLYPAAQNFKEFASGLLALSISKIRKNYILWFRPEVIQGINWAGNPHKPVTVAADGSVTISPRHSFEKWQETVRCKSLSWLKCEVEGALELRSAIVGIVLSKADALAQINVDLERSNNELDAFTYIASHDLKEPLRGIHNYSNLLLQDCAEVLNASSVDKLKTLVRLTQRMEDLINALLHFSRLGREDLKVQYTDLNQLVQNVVEVLRISQKDTQFEIRLPRPLPVIECDRVLVEEVFSNLIGNAIKYNDHPLKWIEVGWLDEAGLPDSFNLANSTQQSETARVFYVRDNGIGIRPRHLEAIFRIFKRLHGQSQYGGGTGAGLTIVKKIVERHGGRIWVESTHGEGSTFYFTFENRE
ncbi:MAG TPA: cyanobacterial phytochrome A [Cyanobacteria bacterium UBA8553]|nr:cyanobacterial phytochrome A [Cyanobacteria bacterium UBA8553]